MACNNITSIQHDVNIIIIIGKYHCRPCCGLYKQMLAVRCELS